LEGERQVTSHRPTRLKNGIVEIIINLDPSPAKKNLEKFSDDAVKEFERMKKAVEKSTKKVMDAIAIKGGEEGPVNSNARKALQKALDSTRTLAERMNNAEKSFGQKQRGTSKTGAKNPHILSMQQT